MQPFPTGIVEQTQQEQGAGVGHTAWGLEENQLSTIPLGLPGAGSCHLLMEPNNRLKEDTEGQLNQRSPAHRTLHASLFNMPIAGGPMSLRNTLSHLHLGPWLGVLYAYFQSHPFTPATVGFNPCPSGCSLL